MKQTQASMQKFTPHLIVTLLTYAFFIASNCAHAGVVVNGWGYGTAWASVWSGVTPPPAPPYITTTGGPALLPGATIKAVLYPDSYAQVNGPANSVQSIETSISVGGNPLWGMPMVGNEAGGDKINGGDDPALFNLVTPTLYSSSINLTLNGGTIENSTTILFNGTFQGDAGTAGCLSFVDDYNSNSPTVLTILDPTGAGTLQSDGSLLFLGSGSGNPAESFSFTITDPAAASSSDPTYLQDYVEAEGEIVGTSVPEPSSIGLLVVGVLAVTRCCPGIKRRPGIG